VLLKVVDWVLDTDEDIEDDCVDVADVVPVVLAVVVLLVVAVDEIDDVRDELCVDDPVLVIELDAVVLIEDVAVVDTDVLPVVEKVVVAVLDKVDDGVVISHVLNVPSINPSIILLRLLSTFMQSSATFRKYPLMLHPRPSSENWLWPMVCLENLRYRELSSEAIMLHCVPAKRTKLSLPSL
jgi:hypothetical protein